MKQCCKICKNIEMYADGYEWCKADKKLVKERQAMHENKCRKFIPLSKEVKREDTRENQETLF